MEFCKTLAVTLKRVDYSNTSQIATFYTLNYGKLQALARGSKRMGKKAPGSIDLFSYNEIIFLKKEPGSLHLLTEWELLEDFPAFRKEIERFYSACYAVDLLNKLIDEGETDKPLFHLLLDTLHSLSRDNNKDLSLLAFELQLLKHLGYLPGLGECTQCGKKFPRNSGAVLSPFQRGLVCKTCSGHSEVGARHAVPLQLSPSALSTANFLAGCKLSALNRLHVPQKVREELKRLSTEYLSQIWGRPVGAWR
ncbi:MAG: DNA repair protein RecO [Planctomycetes bacterium RIFCSPHIGHO2_12_FULL_52_36]|nr:MAG: DNA repair protein RecO [Planctomycetes bacterium RIFCSPHIGHO2_02_FULL_52_58]OHB93983.1 MAG: DNA repair protein RecO [Planctomycetes bacterium RIFCSPHIGHO2_12_FULL_52_36]